MSTSYRRAIFIAYLSFITVLFCLPGSAFPKHSWLDDIWFDKWVHVGLFSVLCFIGCYVWGAKGKTFFLLLFLAAAVYGFLIEVVQDKFIPNRSMDLGDWVADIVGSLLGILTWHLNGKRYLKK